MVDWFLVLAMVISVILLIIISLYVLVHFQHPDDKNEAWLPKGTVILGFVMAGASVLLLPLDVANNENYVGKFIESYVGLSHFRENSFNPTCYLFNLKNRHSFS